MSALFRELFQFIADESRDLVGIRILRRFHPNFCPHFHKTIVTPFATLTSSASWAYRSYSNFKSLSPGHGRPISVKCIITLCVLVLYLTAALQPLRLMR